MGLMIALFATVGVMGAVIPAILVANRKKREKDGSN